MVSESFVDVLDAVRVIAPRSSPPDDGGAILRYIHHLVMMIRRLTLLVMIRTLILMIFFKEKVSLVSVAVVLVLVLKLHLLLISISSSFLSIHFDLIFYSIQYILLSSIMNIAVLGDSFLGENHYLKRETEQ